MRRLSRRSVPRRLHARLPDALNLAAVVARAGKTAHRALVRADIQHASVLLDIAGRAERPVLPRADSGPQEPLVLIRIARAVAPTAVGQKQAAAAQQAQIAVPLLEHDGGKVLAPQRAVNHRASVAQNPLARRYVRVGDPLQPERREIDQIVAEGDGRAGRYVANADDALRHRVYPAQLIVQRGRMAEYRRGVLGGVFQHDQAAVLHDDARHRRGRVAVLIVVHIGDIGGVVEFAVPEHVRIVRVAGKEHAAVKRAGLGAARNPVRIARRRLCKGDDDVVVAAAGRGRRRGKGDNARLPVDRKGGRRFPVHLRRDRAVVEPGRVEMVFSARAVAPEAVFPPAGEQVDGLVGSAAARRRARDGRGRHIPLYRRAGRAVKAEVGPAVVYVQPVSVQKAGRAPGRHLAQRTERAGRGGETVPQIQARPRVHKNPGRRPVPPEVHAVNPAAEAAQRLDARPRLHKVRVPVHVFLVHVLRIRSALRRDAALFARKVHAAQVGVAHRHPRGGIGQGKLRHIPTPHPPRAPRPCRRGWPEAGPLGPRSRSGSARPCARPRPATGRSWPAAG